MGDDDARDTDDNVHDTAGDSSPLEDGVGLSPRPPRMSLQALIDQRQLDRWARRIE